MACATSWMCWRRKMPWRKPARSTLPPALRCFKPSPILISEQATYWQIIREATIHELQSPVMLERSRRPVEFGWALRSGLIATGDFGVLRPSDVQHPGIVFPIMARMSGDLDCIDVSGSRVRHNEEACGPALASTDRLFIASLFLQLHSLVDLLRVMEETPVQLSIRQSMFRGKGSLDQRVHCCSRTYLGRVWYFADVVLYPRTDDAEVTANFIGIAPVVEGPVVAAAHSR